MAWSCTNHLQKAHAEICWCLVQADVVLRGYSGYNTRWARFLLPKVFPLSASEPTKLVTVFFGANDAALPDRLGCACQTFATASAYPAFNTFLSCAIHCTSVSCIGEVTFASLVMQRCMNVCAGH